MKSLLQILNEALLVEAGKDDWRLMYNNQLDFGKYFRRRAKADGYKMLLKGKYKFEDKPWGIDHISVYDGYSEHTKDIPGVLANGDLTFNAAYNAIVNYYKTEYPDWFK